MVPDCRDVWPVAAGRAAQACGRSGQFNCACLSTCQVVRVGDKHEWILHASCELMVTAGRDATSVLLLPTGRLLYD
jgi:hypothetical protein